VDARLGVQAREVRRPVVGVQPAGVRQQPHGPAADRLGLQAYRRLRARERRAVGEQADDRHEPRDVAAHGALQIGGAGAQLLAREVARRARGARDDVRHAHAVGRQLAVLVGAQPPRGVARGVQRHPEAVAGPREVVADLGGAQRRVDADEQHAQPRREDRAGAAQRC
jgi:hypothetical protein